MKISILTLFPEVIEPYLQTSIMKKGQECGAVSFSVIGLRQFGLGNYKQVDDYPYGGGPGMILRPEPVFAAVEEISQTEGAKPYTIVVSPQGKLFQQPEAKRLAGQDSLLFICGHYEGMDERISESLADEEISIGHYILTGGELASLVIIDAVVRLLKGVLPLESTNQESFSSDLLEYPQYTRPAEFRGMEVPPVLLSGDHKLIEKWRRENALRRTKIFLEKLKEGTNTK